MSLARIPFAGLVAAALVSCGGAPRDEQIMAVLEAAEEAAEAKDTGFFRGLISDSYSDDRGRRKQDLIDAIRAFFLVNQRVEVVMRVPEITLNGNDAATVVLQIAVVGLSPRLAGGPVDGELERISIEMLLEGGEWRIVELASEELF